jgi:hypothetical protein
MAIFRSFEYGGWPLWSNLTLIGAYYNANRFDKKCCCHKTTAFLAIFAE